MMTQQVRDALQAELEHVERQLQVLDEKAKALRVLLHLEERGAAASAAAPQPRRAPAAESAPRPETPASLSGIGLRDSLKAVLGQQAAGLKAGEIVERLEHMGYKPGGRSSTRVLVYGEIYRMLKQHKLLRRGGRYVLPQASAN